MSQKAIKKTKMVLLALLGIIAITMLTIWGCGTSDYGDPVAESNATYLAGNAESSTIEVDTLRKWDANYGTLDDGLYKTDNGERVVLIDAIDETANINKYYVAKGHIPGAIINLSHEGGEAMNRNDGPIVEAHDVSDGPAADNMLQTLGITKDAVVVLTTSKMDFSVASPVIYDFCTSRLFWTLKYWGFSNARLKVLNGSNAAWKAAGYKMSYSNPANAIKSTFSVKELPGPNLHLRTTMGEMFKIVDSGKANKLTGEIVLLDMRQPLSGFTADADCPQAITSKGGMAFDGIIKGAVTIPSTSPISTWKILDYVYAADGTTKLGVKYRTKAEIKAAFDAAGIDGTKQIVVNCNSGASAARYWYALSEILGYKNVSVFDASMQVWQTMAGYEPGDTTYVRNDYNFPAVTATGATAVLNTDATMGYTASKFFYWDAATGQFLDAATDLPVPAGSIVAGGNTGGDDTWDTIKRSERVTFRPTKKVNDATIRKTYNELGSTGVNVADQDWMIPVFYPSYRGTGSETKAADSAYHKATSTSSTSTSTGGAAAGGGC